MIAEVLAWFGDGGPVMAVLSVLAVVLAFLMVERLLDVRARCRERRGAARGTRSSAEEVSVMGLRRMGMIRACILAAPLIGLFGTVTGMIETFESIMRGGYLGEMSAGISKALLTTQYGLAIAVPGLIGESVLKRRLDKLQDIARSAAIEAGRAA